MRQYVVDAFTDKVFSGNPAAVCVLDRWLEEDLMCKIALENNYSETAFCVREGDEGHYHLRWFTPGGEVNLCGHATLATSYVITRFIDPSAREVLFDTLSGLLTVKKEGDLLLMDFPSAHLKPIPVTDAMTEALGVRPVEAYIDDDMVCVLENEEQVRSCVANQELVRGLDGLLVHITARGKDQDCITRSFAPKCNVAEDPVCGRGHCHVIPFWADKLCKTELVAYQASSRGGTLYCRYAGDRISLGGYAALFSTDEILVDQGY